MTKRLTTAIFGTISNDGISKNLFAACPKFSRNTLQNALRPGPERLVRNQIGPGGAALKQPGVTQLNLAVRYIQAAENFDNLVVDPLLEIGEQIKDPGQERVQRIAAAPGDPLNTFAQIGDRSQVLRPQVVNCC